MVSTNHRYGASRWTLLDITMRAAPTALLVWLERRRAPLGERLPDQAWREGVRRWRSGRRSHDHFVPL
jgi:hypothetical protein